MSTERFPRDIWLLVEALIRAAMDGTLDPDDMALPSHRTAVSDLLDDLERELYAEPIARATGNDLTDLRRYWAGFRLSRFFALDDCAQVLTTITSMTGAQPETAPSEWRLRAIVDALRQVVPARPEQPRAH